MVFCDQVVHASLPRTIRYREYHTCPLDYVHFAHTAADAHDFLLTPLLDQGEECIRNPGYSIDGRCEGREEHGLDLLQVEWKL